MNRVELIGRLCQDPQSVTFDSGKTVCRFSIAVNRTYQRAGENVADFINIVTWDGLAQNCAKYLVKGNQVAVMGSIQTGSYEKDGIKRNTFDIRADQVEFLTKPNTEQSKSTSTPIKDASIDTLKETNVPDEDMPF